MTKIPEMPPIYTFIGTKFRFLDADPKDVSLIDIAQSLAMTCRYNGHSLRHTSTAAHSVRVAERALQETGVPGIAWLALMHDAPEAYVGDIPTPLKHAMRIVCGEKKSPFDTIEDAVTAVVAQALGLDEKITGRYSLREAWAIVNGLDCEDFIAEASVECRQPKRLVPEKAIYPTGHTAKQARALWLRTAAKYAPTTELLVRVRSAQAYFRGAHQ
jgi:HD containing hydrolase-like enzyme